MSNLVDKQKLLDYLRNHPYHSNNLSKVVESGELDFHPAPAAALGTKDNTLDVLQIKPVCIGAATGKACPGVTACSFISGIDKLPCTLILTNLAARGVSIVGDNKVIWDPRGGKR